MVLQFMFQHGQCYIYCYFDVFSVDYNIFQSKYLLHVIVEEQKCLEGIHLQTELMFLLIQYDGDNKNDNDNGTGNGQRG